MSDPTGTPTRTADPAMVRDGKTLATFTRTLLAEVHANAAKGPFDAENFDLDTFLTSIAEWSEATLADRELIDANPFAAVARALQIGHYHE